MGWFPSGHPDARAGETIVMLLGRGWMCARLSPEDEVSGDREVRLGLMPPLTGIVGLYGPEISWAGQIATDLVNEEGGVLGRRVELVIEDDGSIPETAVPAAERH